MKSTNLGYSFVTSQAYSGNCATSTLSFQKWKFYVCHFPLKSHNFMNLSSNFPEIRLSKDGKQKFRKLTDFFILQIIVVFKSCKTSDPVTVLLVLFIFFDEILFSKCCTSSCTKKTILFSFLPYVSSLLFSTLIIKHKKFCYIMLYMRFFFLKNLYFLLCNFCKPVM